MRPSLESRVRALPCWHGAVSIEPLGGGLSNASFKVVSGGRAYVARLGEDCPAHHVFRHREAEVSRWAHAAGLAPAVRHSGDGALVCDYIEGTTYAAVDVRADLDRVGDLIGRCHRDMARHARGPATLFWVFHVLHDYAATLREHGRGGGRDLAAWMDLARHLEAVQTPSPIVFGHHDLLPANFIADETRLWLIDWEYAGFGTAMFDLANVATNAGLDAGADARLTDVTEARAVLAVMGPRSRQLLAGLCDDDLSNAAFPFGAARDVTILGRRVLALRLTYVGELGYELHMANADAPPIFDAALAGGSARASPVIGRLNRCGSKSSTGPGAPISRRSRRPMRPGLASRSTSRADATFSGAPRSRRSAPCRAEECWPGSCARIPTSC